MRTERRSQAEESDATLGGIDGCPAACRAGRGAAERGALAAAASGSRRDRESVGSGPSAGSHRSRFLQSSWLHAARGSLGKCVVECAWDRHQAAAAAHISERAFLTVATVAPSIIDTTDDE